MIEIEYKIKNYLNNFIGNDYNIIPLGGGMTNTNYLVEHKGKKYVVKSFGYGTDKLINREITIENIRKNQFLEIDAKLIDVDLDSGILVTEYIDDSKTLDEFDMKNKDIMTEVIRDINKLHKSDIKFNNTFNVFLEIDKYISLVSLKNLNKLVKNINLLYDAIELIKKTYDFNNIELKPCHNDLVPQNFIKSNEGLYIIDWEYSGMNDPMADLAGLFIESNINKDIMEFAINNYYIEIKDDEKKRILIYEILYDFLWSIWAVYKYECGIDYLDYGCARFNRGMYNFKLFKELYIK